MIILARLTVKKAFQDNDLTLILTDFSSRVNVILVLFAENADASSAIFAVIAMVTKKKAFRSINYIMKKSAKQNKKVVEDDNASIKKATQEEMQLPGHAD